jgi:hypothetical protein
MQWLTTQSGAAWMVENTVTCLSANNPILIPPYYCGTWHTVPGYGSDTLRAWSTPTF